MFVNSSSAPPELTLFTPEIDGLTVTINGVTIPKTEGTFIEVIYWDWGDGYVEYGWFPNSHTYDSEGTYTIRVISIQSDGLYTQKELSSVYVDEFLYPIVTLIFALLTVSLLSKRINWGLIWFGN